MKFIQSPYPAAYQLLEASETIEECFENNWERPGLVHQLNPVVQTGPREEKIFSTECFPTRSAAAMKLLVSCIGHEQVFASPDQRSGFTTVVPEKNLLAEPDCNLIRFGVFPRREKTGYSSIPQVEAGCILIILMCNLCVVSL